MKKSLLYVIGGLLLVGIIVGVTYSIMKNKDTSDKDNSNKTTETGKITLKDTKKNGKEIVQIFEVEMNGKNVPVEVKYTDKIKTYPGENDNETDKVEFLEGKIGSHTIVSK